MGKLVRDRIPELIRAEGRVPDVRVLAQSEFLEALRLKLQEEVDELLAAPPRDQLDEAADVLEVLLALLHENGLSLEHLVEKAEHKRLDRGGFDERYWWEPA
jgi:predicted house-cleaning noncanonical NTP pyrophosphatase (MazG superfamily)